MSAKKKANKQTFWIAFGSMATACMALVTIIAVTVTTNSTNKLIKQNDIQFVELNRPYITLSENLKPASNNPFEIIALVKNIGKTAASDMKFRAYYNNSEGNKVSLIFQTDELNFEIFYPNEEATIRLLDPLSTHCDVACIENKIFTITFDYRFTNHCVSYNKSFTFINFDKETNQYNIREHSPDEKVYPCE